jgi:hypothetical protein
VGMNDYIAKPVDDYYIAKSWVSLGNHLQKSKKSKKIGSVQK